jgi:peptidoglycan-N-acetylglucosamine deacetylase
VPARVAPAPTVCLTVDFDGLALWLQWDASLSPSRLGRGEFGGRVGMPRLLDLFAAEKVPSTVFVPGHTIEMFPDVCRRALAEGHELGHHGYLHKDPTTLSETEERRELERGFTAFGDVLGVVPAGYRAPGGNLSARTIGLLAEYRLRYDASGVAHDYELGYGRAGDTWTPDGPFTFGAEVDVVQFPTLTSMIDVPQMEFMLSPPLSGLHDYGKITAMWAAELDWMAEQHPGGVLTLVLHPSTVPRGARLGVVRDFIRHARDGGARFGTMDQVAGEWRQAHPLESAAGT